MIEAALEGRDRASLRVIHGFPGKALPICPSTCLHAAVRGVNGKRKSPAGAGQGGMRVTQKFDGTTSPRQIPSFSEPYCPAGARFSGGGSRGQALGVGQRAQDVSVIPVHIPRRHFTQIAG